jgi:hypothetical protein
VNALQQRDMEKIWKADIPTLSTKTTKGLKKEYKEGPGDSEYGARKH